MSRRSLVSLDLAFSLSLAVLVATGVALASPAKPSIIVNGRGTGVKAAQVAPDGQVMVWVRDLERMGLAKAGWDGRSRSAVLVGPGVRIAFQPASSTARVTLTSSAGRPTEAREPLTHPAVQSGGRLIVPLSFACKKLGVTIERRSRSIVNLIQAKRPPTRKGGEPEAAGVVMGKVLFGGRPLPGVVLRLVRDADSTFLPDRQARTDAAGRYRFADIPPGRYRVYAYVGDNPDYFNRETATLTVTSAGMVAPTVSMGRVLRSVRPLPGARTPYAERLSFEWTPCPGAASYEFSAVDPETGEEVAFKAAQAPRVSIAGNAFSLGRRYHWRVVALTQGGDFLGATPGMGAAPWSFVVVAGDIGGPSKESR
ncbi:MAG: hypothetical protein ABSD48_14400 [Armatimonadota bacterium]